MLKNTLIVFAGALTLLTFGCRTPGSKSGLRDAGGDSRQCYSKFTTPDGSGETFEIWATVIYGSGLTDVREHYTDGHDDGGQTTDIGDGTVVDISSMTSPDRGLREYLKAPVKINPKFYDCYSISTSYFCIAKGPDENGAIATMFVTTQGKLKFLNDMTVYKATCAAPN